MYVSTYVRMLLLKCHCIYYFVSTILYLCVLLFYKSVKLNTSIHNNLLHIVAYCSQGCYNGGICTSPYVCTCSAGWIGADCKIGLCICLYIVIFNGISFTCNYKSVSLAIWLPKLNNYLEFYIEYLGSRF